MPELLDEMLREAERAIDHQLRTLEELDDKSEQLIAIGLATVGASAALFAYLVERLPGSMSTAVRAWFALATLTILGGVLAFLDVYAGITGDSDADLGPSLRWLAQKANDNAWTREIHLISLVRSYPHYFEQNERIIARHRKRNRTGLVLIASGVTALLSATFYLLV